MRRFSETTNTVSTTKSNSAHSSLHQTTSNQSSTGFSYVAQTLTQAVQYIGNSAYAWWNNSIPEQINERRKQQFSLAV